MIVRGFISIFENLEIMGTLSLTEEWDDEMDQKKVKYESSRMKTLLGNSAPEPYGLLTSVVERVVSDEWRTLRRKLAVNWGGGEQEE